MKFLFCTVIALVFFGLAITPLISEAHGQFWWPSKLWPDPKKQSAIQTIKTSRVIVKWGYRYPCPLVFCDAYVESTFKEIPKSGIYTKTGKINGRYDWIQPFYILVSDSAGQYSGTRLVRIAEFGKQAIYEQKGRWYFDEGEAGEFERVNYKERISLDKKKSEKTTITMSFTRLK